MFGINDNQLNNITLIIVSTITFIISPYLTELYKSIFNKYEPKRDEISDALEIANEISDKLELIKIYTNSDRAIFSQLHNGGNYLNGSGMKKFSILNEIVERDREHLFTQYQNCPINFFNKYLKEMIDSKFAKIDLTLQNAETYGIGTVIEFHSIKTRYGFGIFSIDNKFIGFLEIDFMKKSIDLTESQVHNILRDCGLIGGVLSKHNKNK